MVKLKASGADLFYDITTPKFGAQAIKKAAELGWKPVHILDINATPVSQTLVPAGLENAKGIISVNYGKDPLDPQWADDAGMKTIQGVHGEIRARPGRQQRHRDLRLFDRAAARRDPASNAATT